jgi:NAD(P)-dependent dehydrogenase (short-subunit alcohol dehydrogenase family)
MRIIVTGGNSGVGRATATALAVAGHSVLIAGRDIPKAERAAAEMAGDVEVAHLDLADLTSVRKFADSVGTVDVLLNNAGVLGLPLTRTADGFGALMGTNYLGHFALTCLLGDRIKDRRNVSRATLHAIRQASGDQRAIQGPRPGDRPPAVGTLHRAHRV